jgi:hypothetical protein
MHQNHLALSHPWLLQPFILVKDLHAGCRYDERFRGYYWNKVQQLMHIARQLKFQFAVHPSAYVVHLPHAKPAIRTTTSRSGQVRTLSPHCRYLQLQYLVCARGAGSAAAN